MFPTLRLCEAISAPFKRAQLGLFGGKTRQSGNNVPFSKKKTRRTWLPNVHNQRLFSETLQNYIRVKVTARALKTIKKHGGIDNYVMKTKPDLLGWEGMRIRVMLREKQIAQGVAADSAPVTISAPAVEAPAL
ncbi:50S ribosomal protein L28 [Phanerochaete sordida]|uniref:Large ribosomal subunit protein bL28c n=1 Tax=Phanerochaete sordida TaxID=48140 RepID=A0A9P3GDW1_9APHY|nr:50S ribosomal protein L28 [Phanerochaete sordida]